MSITIAPRPSTTDTLDDQNGVTSPWLLPAYVEPRADDDMDDSDFDEDDFDDDFDDDFEEEEDFEDDLPEDLSDGDLDRV